MSLKKYKIVEPVNGYQVGALVVFNDDEAKKLGKKIAEVADKKLEVSNKKGK
jgi:hypothetical protein